MAASRLVALPYADGTIACLVEPGALLDGLVFVGGHCLLLGRLPLGPWAARSCFGTFTTAGLGLQKNKRERKEEEEHSVLKQFMCLWGLPDPW